MRSVKPLMCHAVSQTQTQNTNLHKQSRHNSPQTSFHEANKSGTAAPPQEVTTPITFPPVYFSHSINLGL